MSEIRIGNIAYTLKNENACVAQEFLCVEQAADYCVLRVKMSFGEPTVPTPLTVRWLQPMIGFCGQWEPLGKFTRNIGPNWAKRGPKARTAVNAPLLSVFGYNQENKVTVSLSDVKNASSILCGVVEENGDLDFRVNLLTEGGEPITSYEADIRIDRRDVSIFDAVASVRAYWEGLGYRIPSVPDGAYEIAYSTWYNFHQQLDEAELLRELAMAKELGMETVIIDDGWQTDDNSRGYAFCGDWEVTPTKFADMKKFVDAVHQLGMKVMIWLSVPFMGHSSKNHTRFEGKYLYTIRHLNTDVLDPRYREVREFLVDIYVRTVRDYGLDGLKLDFIDEFKPKEGRSNTDYENMDCRSVEEAVHQLLDDVYKALTAVKPDIMLEFRQGYIGPVVSAYGNMLRVADCPNDPLSNRTGIVDLRMLSGVAVHSDMLMWHAEDTVEAVAKQLMCVTFGVPQISVKLSKLSEAHKTYLQGFLKFWKAHRDATVKGRISAKGVAVSYTQVTSENDTEAVTVCYEDSAVTVREKAHFVLNGSPSNAVYLDMADGTPRRIRVWDTAWRLVSEFDTADTLCKVIAPKGGMTEILLLK